MSEANSFLLLPLNFTNRINQKTAPRIERKRDSIEYERSEYLGQFLALPSFNSFNSFNSFRQV